jgi:hypothetical protein
MTMARDFIDDLLDALQRVVQPDPGQLREILIVCGMPERTQNLRYLNYNSQVLEDSGRRTTFSALAVINNRRVDTWRLVGYRRSLSRWVFHRCWTPSPMDYFLNNLRSNPEMMQLLGTASSAYTLLGMLQIQETLGAGHLKGGLHRIRPVVAVPGMSDADAEKVNAFEEVNEIRKG